MIVCVIRQIRLFIYLTFYVNDFDEIHISASSLSYIFHCLITQGCSIFFHLITKSPVYLMFRRPSGCPSEM